MHSIGEAVAVFVVLAILIWTALSIMVLSDTYTLSEASWNCTKQVQTNIGSLPAEFTCIQYSKKLD